ncbi:hypothetical protein [Pseudomonas mosselii]|uniref:hypothetical protein n=1 Tax=Pseudomonas mosselii TaxID=78327 RepID=UPI001F15D10E|nr:hypothetical protein [Pseudomonas mosselii]
MTTEATNVQALMKDCQRGVAGKGPAIEAANNLLAECYGLLGKLAAENEALRQDAERYRWLRDEEYLHNWAQVHVCDEPRRAEITDAAIDAVMGKEAQP